MHMIRKGQFDIDGAGAMSFSDQLFTLAGLVRPAWAQRRPREIPSFVQKRDRTVMHCSSASSPLYIYNILRKNYCSKRLLIADITTSKLIVQL